MSRRLSRAVGMLLGVVVWSSAAEAQRVSLRIAPPEGDTLCMELSQRFDVESSDAPVVVSGEMRVWTHAIVTHRSRGFTDLVSVTDSVRVFPAGTTLSPLRVAQQALEGRTVRLRVDDTGGIMVGRGPGSPFAGGTALPSMLPEKPVAVGESWTRDMSVPLSATGTSTANVRARFRLDSLANHGAVAYISFHGAVTHNHAQDGAGTTGQTVGTLAGSMEVDRRLKWITDSRMTVNVISDIQQPGRPSVHSKIRIMQSLRALVGN